VRENIPILEARSHFEIILWVPSTHPHAFELEPVIAANTTLSADESSGGASVKMTFERVLVDPDGRREVEGVTPRALPALDGDKDQ
jgi:hypothetical protein